MHLILWTVYQWMSQRVCLAVAESHLQPNLALGNFKIPKCSSHWQLNKFFSCIVSFFSFSFTWSENNLKSITGIWFTWCLYFDVLFTFAMVCSLLLQTTDKTLNNLYVCFVLLTNEIRKFYQRHFCNTMYNQLNDVVRVYRPLTVWQTEIRLSSNVQLYKINRPLNGNYPNLRFYQAFIFHICTWKMTFIDSLQYNFDDF